MSHTPGPWQNVGYTQITGEIGKKCVLVATMGQMPCVGGSNDYAAQRGADMEQANAALIAAAPDLLAALRECVAYMPDAMAKRAGAEEAYAAACAAIAKAEGK